MDLSWAAMGIAGVAVASKNAGKMQLAKARGAFSLLSAP
jgi:hypothetical protein